MSVSKEATKYCKTVFCSLGVFTYIGVAQTTDMKIQKSFGLTPFGGLNFVLEELECQGIGNMLNRSLPPLIAQSHYKWKDLIYSFWSTTLCGGSCIEDVGGNFRSSLDGMPWMKVPSPDRILSRFKSLSIPKEILTSPRGKREHDFSFHRTLCELNLQVLDKLGGLPSKGGTLDYDNTILFNTKSDSRYTYKNASGYCPGVAFLNGRVVFIENRNGNSDAQNLQSRTLETMFETLKNSGVSIECFRADSASYQMDVVDMVDGHVEKFYIRARMGSPLSEAIGRIDNWQDLGNGQLRGDTFFTPFIHASARNKRGKRTKAWRLVVTKEPRKDGQTNMFTQDAYSYSTILTSDRESGNDQVVNFYNQRGAIEKEFDVLKNDFNWNRLPFSKMEQNTVFLYLSAMCRNIYGYLIHCFSKKFKGLQSTDRLKKFIYRFMAIPARWIKRSRQMVLRIYGEIPLRE